MDNNTNIILAVFTAVVFMFFIFEVIVNSNKVNKVDVPNININEKQTFDPKISISDNSITQQDNIVRNRRNNNNNRRRNNNDNNNNNNNNSRTPININVSSSSSSSSSSPSSSSLSSPSSSSLSSPSSSSSSSSSRVVSPPHTPSVESVSKNLNNYGKHKCLYNSNSNTHTCTKG